VAHSVETVIDWATVTTRTLQLMSDYLYKARFSTARRGIQQEGCAAAGYDKKGRQRDEFAHVCLSS
jgi:hypothetical protein